MKKVKEMQKMKNNIFITLFAFLFGSNLLTSCDKKNHDFETIDIQNLYSVKPDVGDAVQQKRYEIYKTYGIPVFFNDTVGRSFLQKDLSGDSVFVYETIDLQWNFTSRTKDKFQYDYLTDPDEQMKNLFFIETFLKETSRPLRPFSIFCVKNLITDAQPQTVEYKITEQDESVSKLSFFSGARTLVFTDATLLGNNPQVSIKVSQDIIKEMILAKMTNFLGELGEFFAIAKAEKDSYGKSWKSLDPDLNPGFEVSILTDRMADYYMNIYGKTWEDIEKERAEVRAVIGPFGFVSGATHLSYNSPEDGTRDLKTFLSEMLRYNRTDFEKYWGAYPKVMRKYKILYDFIEKKLEVKL